MQFYSNYAYYNLRRNNNPERAGDFEIGAIKRQKLIGMISQTAMDLNIEKSYLNKKIKALGITFFG